MKKVTDITQELLTFFIVLLSAFAVYKDHTDIAIYFMLVALYIRNTIDVTVIIPKKIMDILVETTMVQHKTTSIEDDEEIEE